MNTEYARSNMVKQQLRTWEISDQTILDLFIQLPREDFLPERLHTLAFCDAMLPIGHEQLTLPPKMEAKILQALAIKPSDKILEIGTGCGFFTALLSRLGAQVFSLDIFREFTQTAEANCAKHHINNVSFITANACHAWPDQAPYDVIVFTASTPTLTIDIKTQLKTGGRLFCIEGEGPAMQAMLYTKHSDASWERVCLFETLISPLLKCEKQPHFCF